MLLTIAVLLYGLGTFGLPATVDAPVSRGVKGTVIDSYTNLPISGTTVLVDAEPAFTANENGEFYTQEIESGTPLTFEAQGYQSVYLGFGGEQVLEVSLRPITAKGIVVARDNGKPIDGASVFLNGVKQITDGTGSFQFESLPEKGKLLVMAPGYSKEEIDFERQAFFDVKLSPFIVKGLYMSFNSAGWQERREHLVELVNRTEANALVIDTKGDFGKLNYKTEVKLAKLAGAETSLVSDMPAFIKQLKKKGIYTIARVVTFKDQVLPKTRPDLAVKRKSNGALFIDDEGLTWLDPFRKEVWDYNLSIAEELARFGFDEIQFDYVRFPSDGAVSDTVYSMENTEQNRLAAIEGFLSEANRRLKPLGVFVSADTFGWTMLREDDLEIGQRIENLGKHLDYLSPMVYPSTWGPGSDGINDPVGQPYEIVLKSLQRGQSRLKGVPTIRIRPWLQDFNDYGPSKRAYGANEIKAQMKAGQDSNTIGWMLWNPASVYTESALMADERQ